jgi:hypothetical protein
MNTIYLSYSKEINTKQLSDELNGVSVSVLDNQLRFVGDIDEKNSTKGFRCSYSNTAKRANSYRKIGKRRVIY